MVAVPPQIIGRDEARALGLKRFFTGKPCRHGHVAERGVSSYECMECQHGRMREWRAANLEKARERERGYARKYRAADPERARENRRRWHAANPEKAREYQYMWRAANKDKISKRQAAQQRVARAGSELNGAGLAGASEGNF